MEHAEKFKNSKEIIAFIAQSFPKCFTVEGEAKPLKIGIFQDLAEQLSEESRVSKTQIRAALRQYTSSWRYLHSIKAGLHRVDLEGNPCELITDEHVEYAQKALAESKAKVQARRKEQQQAKAANKPASEAKVKHKSAKPKSQRPDVRKGKQEQSKKQSDEVKSIKPEELTIGKKVNVNMGKGNMSATVVEIQKLDVRVQLANGLQMVVQSEHLRA